VVVVVVAAAAGNSSLPTSPLRFCSFKTCHFKI